MARKKVRLAWIASDSARRACFRKRRAGLLKKVMELSTLCGVEAAIVVFCPDDEPAFWPSKPAVEQLFRRYEEIPVMERSKKMLSQENFLRERIAKIREQTSKCLKRVVEMEMNDLVYQIVNGNRMYELPISDLTNVMRFLEEKNSEIRKRAQHLHEFPPLSGNGTPSSSSLPPALISALERAAPSGGLDTEGRGAIDNPRRDKWITDKSLVNNIAANGGWNEIGMQQYKDMLGLLHGISNIPMLPSSASNNIEFSQGNTHIPMAGEEMWLPYGNMGGSGTGGIPMESLHGSTDLTINLMGPRYGFNIRTSSGGNQMGLPHRNADLMAGSEIAFPYGTGGGNIDFPVAANQMGLPDRSNGSLITGVNHHGNTDFLMAGNQMGLPYGINDSFAGGNEMGVPHGNSTGMTMVGSEAGLPTGNIVSSTRGHQMGAVGLMLGNEMGPPYGNFGVGVPYGNNSTGAIVGNEMGQLPYGDVVGGGMELLHANVGPSRASYNGVNIMGLPRGNIANSSGGNDRGQLYDVNYQAWFDSLGV